MASIDDYKVLCERIEEILREAVEIEIEFITLSIPCRLIGMNSDLMTQYVKYVADRLLVQLDSWCKDTKQVCFRIFALFNFYVN